MLARSLQAQSAGEIAAKSVEAMGGAANFASIQTLRALGRMRLGQGPYSPLLLVVKRPNMLRMEVSVGSDHVTQAFDGAIGWQSIAGDHKQEPTALTGDSLAHLIDQAANAIGGPLLDLEKRHNKVELDGSESINGANCYRLKVTLTTGDHRVLFIDPASFREVQEEFPMPVNGKPSIIQQSMGDYRKFGPIYVACLIVTREKGGEDSQRMEIESVEINPPVDDAVFKMGSFRELGKPTGRK